jgi:Flp pilus assembly protein TadD
VPRAFILSFAALALAAPSHNALRAQQKTTVTQAGDVSIVAMAMLPMSTSSEAARTHATLGQRALDMGHGPDATRHFQQAVAADPTSAFAQLGAANASTSFADYDAKLSAAAKLAPNASRAEQLQIAIARKTLVNDYVGAEASARELIAAEPKNPRSHLALATVQQQMGREPDARRTMERALAVAPSFSPAYRQLAYSYMTAQPTDPPKAKAYVEKLVALEPTEPQAFIAQGSYFRATNQLPLAKRAYSRAAELDPTMALPVQQRGHVESFLGEYDAARADYDAAAKLGKQNEAGSYRMFGALVSAHAGKPKESIAQLDRLVDDVDGMNLSDPVGAKVNALTAEIQIAIATGDFESASRAIARRTPLVREQVAKASDEAVKHITESNIAYYDGLLAARQGEAATAKAKSDEIMRIVADTKDPQKDQPAHAILGVLALEQKDYKGAVAHLEQANPNDIYLRYERALALDGAGRTADAKALFGKIAQYNFNGADVAVVRAEARKRAQ